MSNDEARAMYESRKSSGKYRCLRCGSTDITTHYDHDCWGRYDGSREICSECGSNAVGVR